MSEILLSSGHKNCLTDTFFGVSFSELANFCVRVVGTLHKYLHQSES